MTIYIIAGVIAAIIVVMIIVVYVLYFMPYTFTSTKNSSNATSFNKWKFDTGALSETPVDCNGKPITNLRYVVDNWGTDNATLRYEYGCADIPQTDSLPQLSSPFDSGKTTDFAGVELNCEGKPIGSIKYILEGKRGIFAYDCLGGYLGEVKKFTTALNSSGGGQNIYLNRHNIQCPENTALGSLSLKSGPGDQIQYEYTCGKVYP